MMDFIVQTLGSVRLGMAAHQLGSLRSRGAQVTYRCDEGQGIAAWRVKCTIRCAECTQRQAVPPTICAGMGFSSEICLEASSKPPRIPCNSGGSNRAASTDMAGDAGSVRSTVRERWARVIAKWRLAIPAARSGADLLRRLECHGSIAQKIQRDQADGPESRVLPATTLVGEQPAVGPMHEDNRAKHFDSQG